MDDTSSSRPSGTPQRVRIVEDDDRSWSDKDSVEVSRREIVEGGTATSGYEDPVSALKRRLSEWGESSVHHSEPYEEGEEYEMLLDPNLPEDDDKRLRTLRLDDDSSLGDGESNFKEVDELEDSPYPEVRAAVRNYDEDMPCNTVRAWTIGMILVVIGASMNTLFSLRSPSIGLGALIAQIIAWPIGQGWAKVMPTKKFNTFGLEWSLNPGPFNIKEHSVIVVMASVSFSVAYATDIILAQVVFYKQDFGILWQLLLTVSTQSLGYGIAGMMRKFLGLYSLGPRLRNPYANVFPSLPCLYDLARKPGVSSVDECHVREARSSGPDSSGRKDATIPVV
jgi:hypothetical protein